MPANGLSNRTLLIIDNSRLIIERILDLVKNLEFLAEIVTARDFNEAKTKLKEKTVYIVLMDIQFPEKNGIEILGYILQNYPDIKVIVVSNQVSDYYKKSCLDMGASYFIDKSDEFYKIPDLLQAL
jgi:DNA-binding NarL/FixJ family response regulator